MAVDVADTDRRFGIPLFLRALCAFLALPGIVAFALPWSMLPSDPTGRTLHATGLLPLAVGFALLLWCIRDFYVAGKGTLAPWDPPRRLVVVGLYRWTRNPMYVAVNLILLGWTLAFRSSSLMVYEIVVMLGFHLRVVLAEEPWLEQTHGDEYRRYKGSVPRWLF